MCIENCYMCKYATMQEASLADMHASIPIGLGIWWTGMVILLNPLFDILKIFLHVLYTDCREQNLASCRYFVSNDGFAYVQVKTTRSGQDFLLSGMQSCSWGHNAQVKGVTDEKAQNRSPQMHVFWWIFYAWASQWRVKKDVARKHRRSKLYKLNHLTLNHLTDRAWS